MFASFGQVSKVIIPQPRQGSDRSEFGFVHFDSHSAAVSAWEASETTDFTLKGTKLTVGATLCAHTAHTTSCPQVSLAKPSVPRNQVGERRGSGGRGNAGGGYQGGYQDAGGAYGVYGNAVAPALGINPMGAAMAGSMLVQTVLPNGQVAYVLAQAPVMLGGQGGGRGGPVRRGDDRPAPPPRRGRGYRDDRYRPY